MVLGDVLDVVLKRVFGIQIVYSDQKRRIVVLIILAYTEPYDVIGKLCDGEDGRDILLTR